jgi:protein O-mannosyl-transferase
MIRARIRGAMGRKSRLKVARADESPAAAPDAGTSRPPTIPSDSLTLPIVLLLVMIAAVFGQVKSHDFVNYDDQLFVYENAHVREGLSASSIAWSMTALEPNWHPVTWLTLLLDVQLFGVHSGAHALINVLFHAAASVLLLLVLLRATGFLWRSSIVAMLFAIHPLHVESVAWISERKDVVSTLFFMLTLLFYVAWAQRKSRRDWILAIVMFILGLLSKGMLVTLPFVLLLMDYWPLRRAELFDVRSMLRLAIEKWPFFALLVPAIWINIAAQKAIAAVGSTESISLPVRIGNAFLAYLAYLRKTVWPFDLAIPYPYHSISSSASIAAGLVVIGVTIALLAWRKHPYVTAGWLWYLGTLVPVIGLVQIGSQSMADRYTYIPLIGIFFAAVWWIADVTSTRRTLRKPVAIATGIILIGFAAIAYRQAAFWKDSVALFTHTLAVTERNAVAHSNLASALLSQSQFDRAAAHFREAIEIRPNQDLPHEGLAMALLGQGRNEEATIEFRKALQIGPENGSALAQLGRMELTSGRSAEAVALLQQAAARDPQPRILGTLALAQGKVEEAIPHFERAVANAPDDADARNDLAAALARVGRDQEALANYEAAIRVAPNQYDARMNLGALLGRLGRSADALEQFKQAAKLRPQSTEPLIFEALLLASTGRFGEAVSLIDRAIATDPANSNAVLTNAMRLAPKETNITEYRAFLASKTAR